MLSDSRSFAKTCLVFTTVPCCLDVFDAVAVIFISPQFCPMTFSIDCASLPRAVAGLHSFFRSRDQCFAVYQLSLFGELVVAMLDNGVLFFVSSGFEKGICLLTCCCYVV